MANAEKTLMRETGLRGRAQGAVQELRARACPRFTRCVRLHLHRLVFPLGVAGMAAPSFALDRHWDSQEGAQVGHGTIEILQSHIERPGRGAAGLCVDADAVY